MHHSHRPRRNRRSSPHGPNRRQGVSSVDFVERVVFIIVAAVMVAVAATIVALVMGWDGAVLLTAVRLVQSQPVEAGILAAVLALGAAYLVTAAFRPGRERTVRWHGELGDVDISIQAVEALAAQAASKVSGIKDLKAQVGVSSDGLSIKLDAHVLPERSIPDLATEVQSRVSSYVHEIVGVPVEACAVRVRGIERKSKVEVE